MNKPIPSSPGFLKDQVALVLGAAGNIGQHIAVMLAEAGATVVIVDDDVQTNLLDTMLKLEVIGGMHTLRAFDISQEQEHQTLVDFVFERFSRLDILVHGASFRAPGTATGIAGLSREMGEEIIRGNLIDPLFFTQRITQEMQHRHIPGSVIFLTSSQVPAFDPAATSSNAAISMLVRELALELAGSGIRVNAVAHGTVTIKSDNLSADPLIPLGYRVMPEDIAAAVCFLASDKARFITGITLPVDGGQRLVSETYLRSRQLLRS